MLKVPVGMEQIAALIELRRKRIRLHGHVTDTDMGHYVEYVSFNHVLGLDSSGEHAGIHVRLELTAHAE